MTVPTCFTSNNSVNSSLFQASFEVKPPTTFLFSRMSASMLTAFVRTFSHFALSRGFTVRDPAGVGMRTMMLSRYGMGGVDTRAL